MAGMTPRSSTVHWTQAALPTPENFRKSTPRRWVDSQATPAQPPESKTLVPASAGSYRKLDEAVAISSAPTSALFHSTASANFFGEDMPAKAAVPAPLPPQIFLGPDDVFKSKGPPPFENHQIRPSIPGDSISSTDKSEKTENATQKASWRSVDTEASTVTAENSPRQPSTAVRMVRRNHLMEPFAFEAGTLVVDEIQPVVNTRVGLHDQRKGLAGVKDESKLNNKRACRVDWADPGMLTFLCFLR